MSKKTTTINASSEMELKNLKSNLQSNCSIMIKKLTGDEYNNMISTIQAYWSGKDADEWIKDLSTSVNIITNDIRKVSNKAQSALDVDLKDFK